MDQGRHEGTEGRARRVQRQRTKGWKMPENTVYVGRPTLFGNDWTVRDAAIRHVPKGSRRAWAVAAFRDDAEGWMKTDANFRGAVLGLKGKNLACWCPLDQPCHADVLLELANQGVSHD